MPSVFSANAWSLDQFVSCLFILLLAFQNGNSEHLAQSFLTLFFHGSRIIQSCLRDIRKPSQANVEEKSTSVHI